MFYRRRGIGKSRILLMGVIMAAWLVSPPCAAKRLVFSQTSDGTSLDWTKSNSVIDQNVNQLMCEGLVRVKAAKLVPGIAEKWEISNDGLVYTFHLRQSKWNDGKELTAHDFEFAIKKLMDPAAASPYAFIGNSLKNGKAVNEGKMGLEELGVKALNDKTLQITLENPSDFFLSSLALSHFGPARKEMVTKYGQDYATGPDKMMYNGPFVLSEYVPQNKKIFKKNPNYWNANEVKLDEIEVLVVADATTALQMYETGALDFADVPSTVFPKYVNKAITFTYSIEWIGINTRKKGEKSWLGNADFVKAVNYSIDRKKFTELSSRGLNAPAQRYVMPTIMGVKGTYGDDFPLNYYDSKADTKKAKEHLKKAMNTLGIKDPSAIEVSYQITSDAADLKRQAEVLQNMISKTLGIKFNITQVEYKQHWPSLEEGTFEMAWMGWVPDYDSPFTYLEIWKSDGYYATRCGFSDKTFDDLMHKAAIATDRSESLKYYFQAEKQLLDVAPIIILHKRQKALLVNTKVKNLNFYFIGFDTDAAFADKK